MTNYPQFAAGQKIRTIYGEIRTVAYQIDCQVFVIEECSGWYPPTKVWAAWPSTNSRENVMTIEQTNPGNWEIILYNPKNHITTVIASGFRTYNEAEEALSLLR